jgi:hypothetical protein
MVPASALDGSVSYGDGKVTGVCVGVSVHDDDPDSLRGAYRGLFHWGTEVLDYIRHTLVRHRGDDIT